MQTLRALNAHLSLSDDGTVVAELIATEFVESSARGTKEIRENCCHNKSD